MQQMTLCFLLNEEEIVLAMKKRGFGADKYNGFGGKPGPGETITQAAIRELREESGVTAEEDDLQKMGEIDFYFPHKPKWDQTVHIYFLTRWEGELKETEEMRPVRCRKTEVDYDRMWDGDRYWLPAALNGKHVKGTIVFTENKKVKNHDLNIGEPGEIQWS